MPAKLRSKFSLLFAVFAVLLAIPAIASADILKNQVQVNAGGGQGVAQIRDYTAGSPSTSISYWIEETSNNCDAADGSAATVTPYVIKYPAGASASDVTIDPTKHEFSACGDQDSNTKSFSFSTQANVTPGDYEISSSVTDDKGQYTTQPATFILRVSAPSGGGAVDDCPNGDQSGDPNDGSCDATGQIMRPVDGGYIYNLRVPDAAVGTKYTIRVNPWGQSANNAASGMYTVLEIRK